MKYLVIISVEGYIPSVERLMPDTKENRKYLLDYLKRTVPWYHKTPKKNLPSSQLYFNQEDDGSMDNAVQLDVVEMDVIK